MERRKRVSSIIGILTIVYNYQLYLEMLRSVDSDDNEEVTDSAWNQSDDFDDDGGLDYLTDCVWDFSGNRIIL